METINDSLTFNAYTDFTLNSDYLSSDNSKVYMYKNSYLCFVTLNFSPSQEVPSAATLIEGLPAPKSKVYFSVTDGGKNARRLQLSTGGALIVDGTALAQYWHSATIMYPI